MGVRALPIYGGAPYPEQIRGLKQGATIVVGTPGRIVDHMERGTLDFSHLQIVILDEADEMISMGFKEDLELILSSAQGDSTQTWLFSATMGREVKYFSEKFLHSPQQVQINRTEVVPDRIDQIYYRAHEEDKPEIICKLIDAADEFYGIIFCQTKALVADLTQYLNSRGYAVDCLHGDMDQNARERAMNGFRNRRSTILICTDVASRGLDVKDVTHVINYSLPRELDNYVHRIGRTARSGKTGLAMNLVTPSHRGLIARIERVTKSKMREGKLPTRKEIGKKKISALLAKFQNQTNLSRASELLDDSWKSAIETMSREEIVSRFLTLTYSDLFQDRQDRKAEASAPAVVVVKPSVKVDFNPKAASVKPLSSNKETAGRETARPEKERSHKAPSWPKPSMPLPQKREKPKSFGYFDVKRKFGRDPESSNDFGGSPKPFHKAKGKWQDRKGKGSGKSFAR
jgi:ATP-dependent RNA helicase DeaD